MDKIEIFVNISETTHIYILAQNSKFLKQNLLKNSPDMHNFCGKRCPNA